MKTNAVRFAAGLRWSPLRRRAASRLRPIIFRRADHRPAAGAELRHPEASLPRPPPDKPKPADTPAADAAKGGHYQGRTFVPD